MPFDLRLLPAFVAVADERHFGRAAVRLGVAQPALSQQIRRLEVQLGVALFERDSRRVELTAAGDAFLTGAREATQAAQRAETAAQRADGDGPTTLRIAVAFELPARVVGRLNTFGQIRSDVDVQVSRMHQGVALAALHTEQVDAVLGWGRMPYGDPIRSLVVDATEIVAILRDDHPDVDCDAIARERFGRHQFVMPERQPAPDVCDWLVTAAAARQPEQLRIQEVQAPEDELGAVLRAATRGCGQTLAAAERFDAAAHPRLRARPFDPPLVHDVLVMWTVATETPLVRDLSEALRA